MQLWHVHALPRHAKCSLQLHDRMPCAVKLSGVAGFDDCDGA